MTVIMTVTLLCIEELWRGRDQRRMTDEEVLEYIIYLKTTIDQRLCSEAKSAEMACKSSDTDQMVLVLCPPIRSLAISLFPSLHWCILRCDAIRNADELLIESSRVEAIQSKCCLQQRGNNEDGELVNTTKLAIMQDI